MTRPFNPTTTEKLRAAAAMRTGKMEAYCAECQRGKHPRLKGPGRCLGCSNATKRLLASVSWLRKNQESAV